MRRGYEQPVSPYVPQSYGAGNIETGNQGTALANPRVPQRGAITSRIQAFSSSNPQGEPQSYDAHRAPAINNTAMAQSTSTASVTIVRAPDATRQQPTQPPEETRASATPTNKSPLAGTTSDRGQPQPTPSQPSQPTTTRCSSLPKLPLTPPQELSKPQAAPPRAKSPAYLSKKNPYGQFLERGASNTRPRAAPETQLADPLRGAPSMAGSSREGRPRQTNTWKVSSRPAVDVDQLQSQPPTAPASAAIASKPVSVSAAKNLSETKASATRAAPPMPPTDPLSSAVPVTRPPVTQALILPKETKRTEPPPEAAKRIKPSQRLSPFIRRKVKLTESPRASVAAGEKKFIEGVNQPPELAQPAPRIKVRALTDVRKASLEKAPTVRRKSSKRQSSIIEQPPPSDTSLSSRKINTSEVSRRISEAPTMISRTTTRQPARIEREPTRITRQPALPYTGGTRAN
ncbi:hypothetical protein V2W45_1502671 [Cenococcum geophilum]